MDYNVENIKRCYISDCFVFLYDLENPQWLHEDCTTETDVIKPVTKYSDLEHVKINQMSRLSQFNYLLC